MIRHESETFLHATIVTNASLHDWNSSPSTNLCSLCDVFPGDTLGLFFLLDHFALHETEQNCNRCATWYTDCTDEV